MRFLIVEPEAEGHHLILYTRLLLHEAIDRNWEVTILTTERARSHQAFQVLETGYASAFRTIEMREVSRSGPGSASLLAGQLKLWSALADACSINNRFKEFDLIYCVNVDYFDKALAVRGSPFGKRPFAGMLMNPKFHLAPLGLGPPSRSDFVYQMLFQRMLTIPKLRRLMVIDRSFHGYCLQRQFKHVEKIAVVGDVGELCVQIPGSLARETLGLSSDAFVILLYGSLSRRKGIDQLLTALDSLKETPVVALIAGKPDSEIAGVLNSERCRRLRDSGKLVLRAQFHDEQSEATVFAASDVVWLGYTGGSFGSSGVLYQAGSAGLPVIAMAQGLVGWTVQRYELGVTVDPNNLSAVVEGIEGLRHNKSVLKRFGENGRRLAKDHTGKKFARTICGSIISSSMH